MAKKTKHTYYPEAKVTCEMDGSVYTLGMTMENLSTDICGNTHPFYTGKEQLIDTAGRIEKFKARAGKIDTTAAEAKEKKKEKKRKTKLSIADLMSDDEKEAATQQEAKPKKSKEEKTETVEKVEKEKVTEEVTKPTETVEAATKEK